MALWPHIANYSYQVTARLEVQRVLVFGSYAWGDYNAYSDLDVVIATRPSVLFWNVSAALRRFSTCPWR
jgi:predicted nucleotidyltransferase